MDANLKTKWVEALRSGEYQQGTGCLRADGKYCCLGVLAHLQGFEFDQMHVNSNSLVVNGRDVGYEPLEALIPEVQLWKLWERNDGTNGSEKHSFGAMADYIEANL